VGHVVECMVVGYIRKGDGDGKVEMAHGLCKILSKKPRVEFQDNCDNVTRGAD